MEHLRCSDMLLSVSRLRLSTNLPIHSMRYIAVIIHILQMRKQGDRNTKKTAEPRQISVIEI